MQESEKREGELKLAATRLEDLTAGKARLEAEHAKQLQDMVADRARLEAEHAALRSTLLHKVAVLDADKEQIEAGRAQVLREVDRLAAKSAGLEATSAQLEARLEGVFREHEGEKAGLHDALVREGVRIARLEAQLMGALKELGEHEAERAGLREQLHSAHKELEVLHRIKVAMLPQ